MEDRPLSIYSLPSIGHKIILEHKNVDVTSYTPRTIQTVIECIQLFQESSHSGRIVIHTGFNKEGRRVYNVELRQNLTEPELRKG